MTPKRCAEKLGKLVSALCWEAEQAQAADDDDRAEFLWSVASRIENCGLRSLEESTGLVVRETVTLDVPVDSAKHGVIRLEGPE